MLAVYSGGQGGVACVLREKTLHTGFSLTVTNAIVMHRVIKAQHSLSTFSVQTTDSLSSKSFHLTKLGIERHSQNKLLLDSLD